MNPLLKKMQLKESERPILILNAPESFEDEMETFEVNVHRTISGDSYGFVQVFGINLETLKKHVIPALSVLDYDGLLWLCYPKKSSKLHKKSDCDRMSVAFLLGEEGFESVRQVAIDSDWSALRLRPVDEIKTLKRSFAASEKGKERIKKKS